MRVIVSEFISLDGVVQAPGSSEEDPSGGFSYGGWSMPYFDPETMGKVIGEFAEQSEALIQGASTYRVSATAWPGRTGPFADWVNRVQKYVVSDTLTDEDVMSWMPTTIIRSGNLLKEVEVLRNKPGGDIYIYGSLTVVRALLLAGLVDELVLIIAPITLGGGKTLFPSNGQLGKFELISAITAKTGAQICRYRPITES